MLLAIGAVLTWGVADNTAAINVAAIGVVFMIAGLLGLGLSIAYWSNALPIGDAVFGSRRTRPLRRPVEMEAPRPVVAPATETHIVRDAARPVQRVIIHETEPAPEDIHITTPRA